MYIFNSKKIGDFMKLIRYMPIILFASIAMETRPDYTEKNLLLDARSGMYESIRDAFTKGKGKKDLFKKINVNAKDDSGKTLLMYAVRDDLPDVVQLLLNHGADPSIKDTQGKNAFSILYDEKLNLQEGKGEYPGMTKRQDDDPPYPYYYYLKYYYLGLSDRTTPEDVKKRYNEAKNRLLNDYDNIEAMLTEASGKP